jgi:hypothetical protein
MKRTPTQGDYGRGADWCSGSWYHGSSRQRRLRKPRSLVKPMRLVSSDKCVAGLLSETALIFLVLLV